MVAFFSATVVSILVTVALTVAQLLLAPKRQQPQQQQAPKPEDGKFNTKQNVPSLSRAYGRVKKAGDLVFLEERNGAAVQVTVLAGHRIEGYHQHYLHDELITVAGGSPPWVITAPSHFVDPVGFSYMSMDHRLGLPLETAYPVLVSAFSDIWSEDHRGDGLASVYFYFGPANDRMFGKVYPQNKPEHSAVLDGALVYDPRTNQDPDDPETWTFSTNLALIRLDHLTHVSGGKLSKSDMHMPDWEAAADVCDEVVLNRDGEEEPRYHGGIWYRYSDDQVEIGRLLDEAAELVVYERSDGKIGVHAGEMVEPDIRITTDDIIAFRYDANRRLESSVLAVRGRYTEPDAVYNTFDAAVFGNPYTGDDTQRTLTVDNQAVPYHNHIQRLQKLAMTRANAPRVSLTVDFNVSEIRSIRERRWVRVHYPERGLDEAIVEIIGRPKLSLHNLTYSFDGIVVPEDLYSFNPVTEEGERPSLGALVSRTGVPTPTGFETVAGHEFVVGGQPQAFVVASWDHIADALTYELQYQIDDESEPAESVLSQPGDTEVRTPALRDNVEYRFRLRAISNGSPSDWTSYETEMILADDVAPTAPTNFDSSVAGNDVTLEWTNSTSDNLLKTELYRGTTSVFNDATLIYTTYFDQGDDKTFTDYDLPNGSYWWWVRSVNASEVASTEVGPETQEFYDADTLAWRAAVITNGGTVSAARMNIVDTFITAEKASGAWALTDDYLGLWGESSVQALTSLKQLRLATVTSAPTFTADRGYVFSGTNYIDTGFIPNTHASAMTATSVHAEVYERTNVNGTSSASAMGGGSGSNRSIRIVPRNNTGARGYANGDEAIFTLPVADSRGLTQMGRTSATLTDVYGAKNGSSMTRTGDPSGVGATLPGHSIYIGGLNASGSLSSGRACSVGYVAWGAALSSGQQLDRYNAVQAWATSIGANV